MQIIKAPEASKDVQHPTIFLAGSIDMGKAVNWQQETEKVLEPYLGTIFNPRRDDWDSSWEQTVKNPQFKEQVSWEWKHLEDCDYILCYFAPKSEAPITFGEFTRHFDSGKIFVACAPDWWRRGNVEVLCDLAGIPCYETLDEARDAMIKVIESKYAGQ